MYIDAWVLYGIDKVYYVKTAKGLTNYEIYQTKPIDII